MNLFDIPVEDLQSKYKNIVDKMNSDTHDDELGEFVSELNGYLLILKMRNIDIPELCIECKVWDKECKEVVYISEWDACYHKVCTDCYIKDEIFVGNVNKY